MEDLELKKMTETMLAEMCNGLEPGENPDSLRERLKGAARVLSTSVTQRFTNSSLATLKVLSPNCSSPRNHNIDRLTPHHTAGVLSVRAALEWFKKATTRASCTYVIGYDGVIGQCVEEKNRPWTSSSSANDNRAITFEVCNSGWEKDGWPISDKAFNALVNLCVDICRRYGKKKLLYISDKTKALAYEPKADEMLLTKHEWFANTECPGPGLGPKFPELAARVTAALNKTNTEEEEEEMVTRYNKVEELPSWYRKDIQKLIDEGFLRGKEGGKLDLTEDMVRTLIICGRMQGVLK